MITEQMKKYVKEQNIEMVRRELLAIVNADPDMGAGFFTKNLDYAEKELTEEKLYVPFSGGFEIQMDKACWDKAYDAKIYLQLRKEFSKELVYHLKEVAPVAYKAEKEQTQPDQKEQFSRKVGEAQTELLKIQNVPQGNCKTIKTVLIVILVIVVIICLVKLL